MVPQDRINKSTDEEILRELHLPVNIVAAHALEAKALIPMLSLQPLASSDVFPLYQNAQGLELIVSGMGKDNISAAVKFLASRQSNVSRQSRGWLNIGIAGHRDAALGSIWLANKVTDKATGANAYPGQLIGGVSASQLVTVDEPERHYPLDALYDMEASAFFDSACKCTTSDTVQMLKIVSDNLENPLDAIDLKQVPRWIASQESVIKYFVKALAALVCEHNSNQALPPSYHAICVQTRLSVTQKLQLERLCQRYRALSRESELEGIAESAGHDAKRMLIQMVAGLENQGRGGVV